MSKYSGRENHELEGSIDRCVSQFINLLRSKYVSTEGRVIPVDMSDKIQYFTLDVISTVAYGKAFGMLKNDEDVGSYIQLTNEGLTAFKIVLAFGLHWLLHAPIIGKALAPSPSDKSGFGRMMGNAFAVIDEREANPTDKQSDMLASFMRNGIVGAELRSEVMGQIVAGADTTASAIRGIILQVASNPRVNAKLCLEIEEAAIPEDKIITYAKAKSLPYLQAVIREGLRCWTPVVALFPRVVPPEGDTAPIGDGKTVFLPGGTMIAPSSVAMHYNPEVYGDDAEVFRPERWFESDKATLEKMKQTNDFAFGSGRYGCLGKPVAYMEMSKIIFEVRLQTSELKRVY